ncbi:hypothetical protein [Gulosibacter sp. ACHW.36C]|uniref:DUF4190 domain-containing protein n=1 Tax=Gulosibacter sediminis TaxID=1729695 RepID=A0ABY4MYM1_9MICO|nr:hypothetical protein [Gulosibacter sediminis]UQN14303.1 hypothetical protein M3M28_09600 [Gulosibacter sediminis]
MTDSEGANTQRPHGEDEQIVPASGGTFGVTDDRSDFGRGPIHPRDAGDDGEADDSDTLDVDGLTNDDYTDRVQHPEHREYGDYADGQPPLAGQPLPQQPGQQAPGQQAQQQPGGYGAPPVQQPGYGQPREQEFAPTQFGAPAVTAARPTFSYVGLALALVALILLCFPGILWIIAGALGVIGLVVSVVAMSREPNGKALAGIGIAGSAIAIAIAIATAIVVAL